MVVGEFGPHHGFWDSSGQGSHYGPHHGFWDSKGLYEDKNTIVI
jgi:hypothetical protein